MKITVELLRKRSEHNDGCLATLEEIALHQQEIEKIEVIGDVCRDLQILYLCNNYIPKIEGLYHLKKLTYLNLAINNIKIIEGLQGCEMLEKLDLTLNFIVDLDSVINLRANRFLHTLHLTGNPCTNIVGYRGFVIHALPQLECLDSKDIEKDEKIKSRQNEPKASQSVVKAALQEEDKERIKQELIQRGIDPFPPKYNEKEERVYGHSPEERMQILRSDQEAKEKRDEEDRIRKKERDAHFGLDQALGSTKRLTAEEEIQKYDRLLLRNEGKVPFRLIEDDENELVLTLEPGKYISTASIQVDLQPTYVRVYIKDKLLQLVFQKEVVATKCKVERSHVTGQLKLSVPWAPIVRAKKKTAE